MKIPTKFAPGKRPTTSALADPASLIAGRLDVMRQLIPGLNTTLELGGILALLREDASYCATAATASQASEIAGRDITQPTSEQGGAVWTQTDEGREAERVEKKGSARTLPARLGRRPGVSTLAQPSGASSMLNCVTARVQPSAQIALRSPP